MTATNRDLPGGDTLSVFDCFLPGAKAGSYTLRFTQRLLNPKEPGTEPLKEIQSLSFDLSAPRFCLPVPAEDVRSCYPPPGADANHGLTLPHVVLKKRSLPWERVIEPARPGTDAPPQTMPWLALLVLGEDDLRAASFQALEAKSLTDAADPSRYCPWADAALGLKMSEAETAERPTVLELPADRFRRICPGPDVLPLLSHVRQVDLSAKLDGELDGAGEFSVLLSHRFPREGGNTAVLVSLEGFYSWLKAPAAPAHTRVRLVVLHQWSFHSRGQVTTFSQQAGALGVGLLAVDAGTAKEVKDPQALRRLDQGYLPIAHRPDGAETTLAWYRGPLAPAEVAPLSGDIATFERGDSALIVDPDTGLLDVSYAAAWHLGRLLGLSSAAFAGALLHWNQVKLREQLCRGQGAPEPRTLAEEMEIYQASHSAEGRRGDPLDEDVKIVTDWLARLLLLVPVPLRYLVPSARMLPPESLRFFQVDPNWLDALTEGALSLGVAAPGAAQGLRGDRGRIRRALGQMMARRRLRPGSTAAGKGPLCGFLLRSEILDRFPGLEIQVFDGETLREPLRMERAGVDVLLVLVEGRPTHLLLKEPREGLNFSAYAGPALMPRQIVDQSVSEPGGSQPIPCADNGVVDVLKLAQALPGGEVTSGARFALHWLRPPQDLLIGWASAATGATGE